MPGGGAGAGGNDCCCCGGDGGGWEERDVGGTGDNPACRGQNLRSWREQRERETKEGK